MKVRSRKVNARTLFCAAIAVTACSSGRAEPQKPETRTRLYPVQQGNKAGFIDSTGKTVVPLKFDQVRGFSEGLAAVLVRGKWGFVNERGEIVVEPKYWGVGPFSEGRAVVLVREKRWYIDKGGNEVVGPQYRIAAPFSDGLALAYKDNRPMFIDRSGKVVLTLGARSIETGGFSEGLLFVRDGRDSGYIDKTGKMVITLPRGNQGLVNKGEPFSEGLAAVMIDTKWGFMDKNGEIVIKPQFRGVGSFYEGYASVYVVETIDGVEHNRWGFIDKTGTILGALKYGCAGGFSGGLANVVIGDKWGFIDRQGNEAIRARFEDARSFVGELAKVKINEKDAYINKSGKVVWTAPQEPVQPPSQDGEEPALETYSRLQKEGNHDGARDYIPLMTRAELVQGCLMTLEWAIEDPERTKSSDVPRWLAFALGVVGPFLQIYSRSFLRQKEPIDPTPFHKMLLDERLDPDFRFALAQAFGHHSFYLSSFTYLEKDVRTFTKLLRDKEEREDIRVAAMEAVVDCLYHLYRQLCTDCPFVKKPGAPETGERVYPDVVKLLREQPKEFTAEQRERWQLLFRSAEEVTRAILSLTPAAASVRSERSIQRCLEGLCEKNLLTTDELQAEARKVAQALRESRDKKQ